MPISRRKFLTMSALGGAGALVATQIGGRLLMRSRAGISAATQVPIAGAAIPQFVDPLPLLSVAGGSMETVIAQPGVQIPLSMREFQANVMPSTFVAASGPYTGTWVWGYRAGVTGFNPAGTYIGPVIVSTRGVPTEVRYTNNLTTNFIAWRDWTDQTLHWADPLKQGMDMMHYMGPPPAVPHLHGGEVPGVLDGGPDAWFTSDGAYHGPSYYTRRGKSQKNESVYRYPNTQEAAPLWFHDHLLGGTRLNVYAGLAGAHPLIDPNQPLPTGLHPVGLQQGLGGSVDFLIPLVLQDRMFDTNGQLFFPNTGINPEHPFWIPEFEGDTNVVNGKVWPYVNVQPRRYRFLFINGSNARAYEMFLVDQATSVMGPPMWQIATDGGYLDAPVKVDPNGPMGSLQRLVLLPGERAEVIIDFAGLPPGTRLLMRNIAKHPYPGGAAPMGNTLGRIVQFRVVAGGPSPDLSYDPATSTQALRPPMVRLVNPAAGTLASGVAVQKTRALTLNEVQGPGGPLEVLVNNTKWSGRRPDGTARGDFTPVTLDGQTSYYSELPNEGDTEVWEVINLTEDAHPIHLHLVQFQLMNRQAFDTREYDEVYQAAFPGGEFIPAYGPPLDYNDTTNPMVAGRLGGNPDLTPSLRSAVMPPFANEAGWKDTVIMFPGQVTRIAVRFAPTSLVNTTAPSAASYPFEPTALGQGHVWHCHIVDHEDNEMMRPHFVKPHAATRTYKQGKDY